MVECVEPVIAANGHKAGGGKTPVEDFRHRFADPVQIGLIGEVLEGQHQEQFPPSLAPTARRASKR